MQLEGYVALGLHVGSRGPRSLQDAGDSALNVCPALPLRTDGAF